MTETICGGELPIGLAMAKTINFFARNGAFIGTASRAKSKTTITKIELWFRGVAEEGGTITHAELIGDDGASIGKMQVTQKGAIYQGETSLVLMSTTVTANQPFDLNFTLSEDDA